MTGSRSVLPQRLEQAARQMPRWGWWTLGGVLAFGVLVLILRGPLAGWMMPQTKVQTLLREAETALAEGRLDADDGGGARALFEAVVAIDPDRPEGRAGLARVALLALSQADQRLRAGDVAGAEASLALARELSAPRHDIDAVARRLRQQDDDGGDVEHLLARAREAQASGALHDGADSALALYVRVLEREPANVEALEGREDMLAERVQEALAALRLGQLHRADALIDSVRGHDPGHVDLPNAEAEFTRGVERVRQQAGIALRRQRLEQAEADFRLLLQVDPDDGVARRGLEDVARAHLARAARVTATRRFNEAAAAIARAHALAPGLPELEEAGRQLQQARRAGRTAADAAPRVRQLLAEARAAEARGALMAPPGDSAFDKLRAARALAPDDPDVQAAAAGLARHAARCFETELPRNNLAGARACLDAGIALLGDVGEVRVARRRLAERWIAVGEERLGAGDLPGASRAAEQVAELEPGASGLAEFQRRLGVAESGLR